LALSGARILRLAELLVGEPIRPGALFSLLTDVHHAEPIGFTAIYLAGRHRLPKVRVFLDFLIEKFSRAPWRIEATAKSNASH
jgi:DNA-binding transcriptional LysR family regulator